MRFVRLELQNWRSFKGRQSIEFSTAEGRNVTVFVGQNGSGKTALLNAFTWVLYEETTEGFRRPHDLFNHSSLAEIASGGNDRVEVALEFEHDGEMYVVRRSQEAVLREGDVEPTVSEPVLNATRTANGLTTKIEQQDIDKVLPPGLHPFFFFPAENIGKDIDQNDAAAIRASMSGAIDVLLRLELYDNALRVVSTALGDHLRVPRNAPRDEKLQSAEKEAEDARQEWENQSARSKEIPAERKRVREAAEALRQQLEATDEYQEEAREYAEIEQRINTEEATSRREHEAQIEDLNHYCVVVFGNRLFANAAQVLQLAYDEGRIPPRVSAGLLDELLNVRRQCICGRGIDENERRHLEELLALTVDDHVAEVASNLRGRLPALIESEQGRLDVDVSERILDHASRLADAEIRREKLDSRLRELSKNRPEVRYGDPGKIREAWETHVNREHSLRAELQSLNSQLPMLEIQKNKAERAYQQALSKHSSAKTIGKARELLSWVEETLSHIQESIRSSARKDVERAMNQFFVPLLLKDYRIRLTEDFRYRIADVTSERDVGASSSEVALATFAFVGALAGLMPVYSKLDRLVPKEGGPAVGELEVDVESAYPVVLDAPYSPFGEDYARDFSENLPSLFPQSVVIVREDQVSYVNMMVDAGRVGAAYVLELHSGEKSARPMTWGSHQVPYVVASVGGSSHTEIKALPVEG